MNYLISVSPSKENGRPHEIIGSISTAHSGPGFPPLGEESPDPSERRKSSLMRPTIFSLPLKDSQVFLPTYETIIFKKRKLMFLLPVSICKLFNILHQLVYTIQYHWKKSYYFVARPFIHLFFFATKV